MRYGSSGSSFVWATLATACTLALSGPASAQTKPDTKPETKATKPDAKATKPDPKAAPKADPKADPTKKDAAPTSDAPKTAAAPPPADEPPKSASSGAPTSALEVGTVEPPAEQWDASDVEELPNKTYLFVGTRYRGTVIPGFLLDLFVDGGKTIYSNSVGAELDIRKNGFSLIPAISFTEYGTGDIVFKQKNTKDIPGNYSLVNSSMKAVYVTADLLWSAKLSKNIDFEYGAGFGVGVLFGDLMLNWVRRGPDGSWVPCAFEGEGGANSGCNKADHQNADTAKVGGYTEKSWLDGGSKPNVFPHISFPQVGLRFKPVKQFQGRLGVGWSLTTGFWFGFNGDYGLEQPRKRN